MLKMNLLKKYKIDFFAGILLGIIVMLFILLKDHFGILSNREMFQEWIEGFGVLAPIITILFIILEVVIAPIPGLVPSISAGFIFGTIPGAIYTFIGNMIGTLLLFYLSRKFGRFLILKFIDKEKLCKYEKIVKKREKFLFALYFFPVFPLDIITAAIGLSNIKFRNFIIYVSLGYAFHVILINYFGDYLANLYFF